FYLELQRNLQMHCIFRNTGNFDAVIYAGIVLYKDENSPLRESKLQGFPRSQINSTSLYLLRLCLKAQASSKEHQPYWCQFPLRLRDHYRTACSPTHSSTNYY